MCVVRSKHQGVLHSGYILCCCWCYFPIRLISEDAGHCDDWLYIMAISCPIPIASKTPKCVPFSAADSALFHDEANLKTILLDDEYGEVARTGALYMEFAQKVLLIAEKRLQKDAVTTRMRIGGAGNQVFKTLPTVVFSPSYAINLTNISYNVSTGWRNM